MTEPAPSSVWTRPRPEPRRRAPGVDQYVATALAIADAEGLAAVSMRRVAGDLGSGTATLYRYITNRDELVELMVDAAQGEEPLPEPAGTGAPTWPRSRTRCARPCCGTHGWRANWRAGPRSAPTRCGGPNPRCAPPSRSRPTSPWPRRRSAPCTRTCWARWPPSRPLGTPSSAPASPRSSGSAASAPTSARSSRRASTRRSPAASTKQRNSTPTPSSRSVWIACSTVSRPVARDEQVQHRFPLAVRARS